jgi:hypothetical protein
MTRTRSFPHLTFLNSVRFANVNSLKTQLRRFSAEIAICMAICAVVTTSIPAFGRSGTGGESLSENTSPASIEASDSAASHENLHFGFILPDGQQADFQDIRQPTNLKGTFTVEPNVKKLLGSAVAYNDKCREVSTGSWKIDTLPDYGKVATGLITGTLSTGACPGIKFTSAAIYYTWTKATKAKQDGFKATYLGYIIPVNVTFVLNLKQSK